MSQFRDTPQHPAAKKNNQRIHEQETGEFIDPKEASNCSPVFPCEAMSDAEV